MNLTRNEERSGTWLAAGWCALLLYVSVCSPLGLGLAALAGSLDPNHQLLLGAGAGGSRLVLHHGSHCLPHHHGLAARALTLFAQPANTADPDHVLQFSSADTLKGQARASAPQPDWRTGLVVSQVGEPLPDTTRVIADGLCPASPRVDATRLSLRSTVLLI